VALGTFPPLDSHAGRKTIVAEEVKKVWDAAKGGYEVGKDINEKTGAGDAWGDAAYNQDPELAKSAADDWDKGDHMKAIGKFARASGEALVDGVEDFWDGLTGHVDAEAPPAIDLPSTEEISMPDQHVEHETMP
jgi:hypothetical protein